MILNKSHNPYEGILMFRPCWNGYSLGLVDQIDSDNRTARVRYDLAPSIYFHHLHQNGLVEFSPEQQAEIEARQHPLKWISEQKFNQEGFDLPECPDRVVEYLGQNYSTKDMCIEIPYDALLVYGHSKDLRRYRNELPKHWVLMPIFELKEKLVTYFDLYRSSKYNWGARWIAP